MKKYSLYIVGLILVIALAGCSTSQIDNNLDIVFEPTTGETVNEHKIDLKSFGIDYYRDSQLSSDGVWLLVTGMSYDYEQDLYLNELLLINNYTGVIKVIDEADWIYINDISSNGELILYMKNEENSQSFYLYLYNKSEITKLSSSWGAGSISPDSSKIAYVEYEKGLFVYDIEAGSSQLLSEEKEPLYPIWFPDNKHIFYFTDLGQTLTDGAGQLQGLAKINIETKEKQLITDDSGKYRSASWIVPGKKLHVFAGWDDGYSNAIIDLTTNTFLDLGEDYQYFTGRSTGINEGKELFYINIADKVIIYDGIELVDEIAKVDNNNPYKYISFSPDGQRMAYFSGDIYAENSKGRDIWVADADGKNAKKITNTSGYYYEPMWIDNKSIVAIENTEEEFIVKYFDITE